MAVWKAIEGLATGGWGSKATGLVHVYSNGKGLLNYPGDNGPVVSFLLLWGSEAQSKWYEHNCVG